MALTPNRGPPTKVTNARLNFEKGRKYRSQSTCIPAWLSCLIADSERQRPRVSFSLGSTIHYSEVHQESSSIQRQQRERPLRCPLTLRNVASADMSFHVQRPREGEAAGKPAIAKAVSAEEEAAIARREAARARVQKRTLQQFGLG